MGNRWRKAQRSSNGKEISFEEKSNKKEIWIKTGVKYPDWGAMLLGTGGQKSENERKRPRSRI